MSYSIPRGMAMANLDEHLISIALQLIDAGADVDEEVFIDIAEEIVDQLIDLDDAVADQIVGVVAKALQATIKALQIKIRTNRGQWMNKLICCK